MVRKGSGVQFPSLALLNSSSVYELIKSNEQLCWDLIAYQYRTGDFAILNRYTIRL